MAAATSSVAVRSSASGFSQNVGRRRPIDSRISVAWAFVAAAMTTASASSNAASIDAAARTPVSAATAAARSGIGVGDDDLVDARRRGEQPRVEPTDPARAELGDLHRARASTSAARPIRSDSAGASHVLSCSTISQPP